jgi:hypothetical protein
MAQNLYQQCESSGWLEKSECSNPKVLGVGIRRRDEEYTFEPASLEPQMMAAIRSIGLQFAFTMSSAITSAMFNNISPHQKEITIHLRGIRIPVVSSLKLVPSRSFEIKQSLACLLQEERIVLLCTNTIESAVPHGSDIEQMLMEMVSYLVVLVHNMLTCNRSGAPVSVHLEHFLEPIQQ